VEYFIYYTGLNGVFKRVRRLPEYFFWRAPAANEPSVRLHFILHFSRSPPQSTFAPVPKASDRGHAVAGALLFLPGSPQYRSVPSPSLIHRLLAVRGSNQGIFGPTIYLRRCRGQEVRDNRGDADAAGARLHARRHVQRAAHAP
jgi:hypothetical protein